MSTNVPSPRGRGPSGLTELEERFIAEYTDQSSPNYRNGTQAMLAVGNCTTPKAAGASASTVLARTRVRTVVSQILEQQGAGVAVRLQDLTSLALGHSKQRSRTVTRDADGKVTGETEHETDTPHSARIRAHDVLAKLAGDYDVSASEAHIMSQELRNKADQLLRRARKVARHEDEVVEDVETVEDTGDMGGNGGGSHISHSASQIPDGKTVDPDADSGGAVDCSQGREDGRGEVFYDKMGIDTEMGVNYV